MGIFQEMIEMVNRTSRPLNIRFDGQDMELAPNYTAKGERIEGVTNMVPKIVLPYALNQNVVMGSEDAIDPSDFKSLIGVVYNPAKEKGRKHSWHDCSFLEQSDKLTRTPLEDVLQDPNATIQVRGKVIPRASDAAINTQTTPFDPR